MIQEIVRLFLPPLIAGAVVVLLTNILGAHYSFARFRKEQWWQEKRQAYDSIIRALAAINLTAAAEMRRLEIGQKTDAMQETLKLNCSLQQVASAGAYIVSQETVKSVQSVLQTQAGSHLQPSLYKCLEAEYEATESAIKVIRAEAHKDLGVSSDQA